MAENNIKPNKGDIESALRFGAAMGTPRTPVSTDLDAVIDTGEATPYVVLPDGYAVHDLEHLLPQPTRKRAKVSVTTHQSFIDYTKRHGSLASCVIYADVDAEKSNCSLVAIMDDHSEDEPQWRDHRCTFIPRQSVEWARWISKNKVSMSQADFAAWLEENLGDIASVDGSPTGADILKMALAFEATSDKRLKSRINLQSGGARFEYVDDEDKDTRTAMEVFERFTLALPVFDGSSDAYPVTARLKYREKQGLVTFWYELIRPDRAFRTAVQSALDAIKEATGFPIIYGNPGS